MPAASYLTKPKGPRMLNIAGPAAKYCDGVSRRSFLKVGAFAFGATYLSLADIYRAEANLDAPAARADGTAHKAVINVFLGGGPPHQDMWDIKTEAPVEIRGELGSIRSALPYVEM